MGQLKQFDPGEQDGLLQAAQLDPQGPAMDELLKRYEPLVLAIAKSLTRCHATRDDVANAARLAFVQAVARHQMEKAGFAAFASIRMRSAASRTLRSWTGQCCDGLPEDHDPPAGDREDTLTWGDGDVAGVVAELPLDQRQLLSRRYMIGESLDDLARTAQTSASAVGQRLRTAERQISKRLSRA